MAKCPTCRRPVSRGSYICQHCGGKLPPRYFDVGSYFGLRHPLAIPFTVGEIVLAIVIIWMVTWGVVAFQDVLAEASPNLPLHIVLMSVAVETVVLLVVWTIRIVGASGKKKRV